MKTVISVILDSHGRLLRWMYISATDLMAAFFVRCAAINYNKSITEEQTRYSKSPFYYRNKNG